MDGSNINKNKNIDIDENNNNKRSSTCNKTQQLNVGDDSMNKVDTENETIKLKDRQVDQIWLYK